MRLWLPKLQNKDEESKALRVISFSEEWLDVERVFENRGLPYAPEIIGFKVISCHYNDPLAGHFRIDKTKELIGYKSY